MLILNEQVKPAQKNTIFNAETTIKNIHKKKTIKHRSRNFLWRTMNF